MFDRFLHVCLFAFLGALLGMIGGLILGTTIVGVFEFLAPAEIAGADGPGAIGQFLGMGWGAVVGSILGGVSGIKEKK